MVEPRRRILVVEDEYFIAEELREALDRLGATVVGPVPTGEKALALLKSEPIDMAVLDINLRGEMSFAVADALEERGIPFVFATGYDHTAVPERYRDIPHWAKPFDPEQLVLTALDLQQP
jgi:CheY-like chemotaxis protein